MLGLLLVIILIAAAGFALLLFAIAATAPAPSPPKGALMPKPRPAEEERIVELVPVEKKPQQAVYQTPREDEVPEEVQELFGELQHPENPKGYLETSVSNYFERKKIKSEIKTIQQQAELYATTAQLEESKVQLLQKRRELVRAKVESGALSQEAITYLRAKYPGFVEESVRTQELAGLKHELDKEKIISAIAELRNQGQPRNLFEYYKSQWQREIDKWTADVTGMSELHSELLKVTKRLAEELNNDAELTDTERQLLKSELERYLKAKLAKAGFKL